MSGTPLTDSREAIVNAVVDTMGAFQKTCNLRNNLLAPKEGHLKMYAMYALAMLKHVSFFLLLLMVLYQSQSVSFLYRRRLWATAV